MMIIFIIIITIMIIMIRIKLFPIIIYQIDLSRRPFFLTGHYFLKSFKSMMSKKKKNQIKQTYRISSAQSPEPNQKNSHRRIQTWMEM